MGKFYERVSRGLILHVRHLGWLSAVPKPPEGTVRAKATEPRHSRLEQLQAKKITPQLPPNPAPLITNRLWEIGPVESYGMGSFPISWLAINEWQRATDVRLTPWEARMLRRLSSEYLVEQRKGEDENRPPPWRGEVTQAERDADEAALRAVLG